MRKTSLMIKIIAAICIYLTWSITTTSAVEISIYNQLTGGEPVKVTLNPSDVIDKKFDFVRDEEDTRGEYVKVKIEVTGKDSDYPINKIYLFKCKDSNPLDCIDYEPVEADSFLSAEKGTFDWKDVSRGTTANFLTLVKFTHDGEESWVGYWDTAVRKSSTVFEKESYDISELDLYTKPGYESEWIQEFLEKHKMVPASWIDRAVIKTIGTDAVTEMYQLLADGSEIAGGFFSGRYRTPGNMITSFTKDYLLAFAVGSIANPVTFYKNEIPVCGDGECVLGENPDNCCLDCGCSEDNQQCTSNDDYSNGVCHVCGDGIIDPVENSTNCCADAGCPGNQFCDDASKQCKDPSCKNNECEPTEDSKTCAYDCWDTEGKTCADSYGDDSYYYDSKTQDCVQAVCPNDVCEWQGGEDYSNCCADCDECPQGEYCKTSLLPQGVCTSATCGNGICETSGGEDYTNCCEDCACPVDSSLGVQLSCDGVCHVCENGKIEAPYETSENCCQDVGCTSGYCSATGSCLDESDMVLTATILPSSIDCTQTGSTPKVRFTPTNAPYNLDSYESVKYTYNGGLYTLDSCSREGDAYICDFPLSFQGCFDAPGSVSLDFIVTVTYFDDGQSMNNDDLKYRDIGTTLDFDISKTRQRVCERDSSCDAVIGENSDACCWDCGCSGDEVCTSASCKEEAEINLFTRPEDLPSKSDIDCSAGRSSDTFSFTARVNNVPESAYESFRILTKSLEYKGKKYTASNMPGFECTALTATDGGVTYHTGEIVCEVPVAYFPACTDPEETARVTLNLNVLGGGLSKHYNTIDGKALSTTFDLEYIQGLPKCGDGEQDPSLGETQETCCQDMGCPDEKVCTSSGCVEKSEIGLIASIDPTIDCTVETSGSQWDKEVSLDLSLTHKPYSPETNGVTLDTNKIYIGDKSIRDMMATCTPADEYGQYEWTCLIPTVNFNPFCWDQSGLELTETVKAQLSWMDRDGSTVKHDVQDDVTFTIDPPRIPVCNGINGCEYDSGEDKSNCCWDCGCSGTGSICTADNYCVDESNVKMNVEVLSPTKLDCEAGANDNNNLKLKVTITNVPYDIQLINWFMTSTRGDVLDAPSYFSCTEDLSESEGSTGVYDCVMPVYDFPDCGTTGDKEISLQAKIRFISINKVENIEVEDHFTVNVNNAGNPLCGDSICQGNLNENPQTCCDDCGCDPADGDICISKSSCVDASDLRLVITPTVHPTTCNVKPGTVDMQNYVIENYWCDFQDNIVLNAKIVDKAGNTVKPANAVPTGNSYIWSYKKLDNNGVLTLTESPYYDRFYATDSAFGWDLTTTLNQDGKFVTQRFNSESEKKESWMKDITLTIESSTYKGTKKEITLTSYDDVKVDIDMLKNDDLLNYEDVFNNMREAKLKAEKVTCSIVFVLATCVACSLIAGGVDQNAKDIGLDKLLMPGKTPQDVLDGANNLKNKFKTSGSSASIISLATGMTGTSSFGSISPTMFTSLVGNLQEGVQAGKLISGVIAGGLFAYAGEKMLGCTGSGDEGDSSFLSRFWVKVAAAVGVCAVMMYAAPSTLVAISRGCDVIASLVPLIYLITDVQRSTQQYQVCMMSAEAYLARAKASNSDDPYYLATATSSYYERVASCSKASVTNTNRILQEFTQLSYTASGAAGWSSSGVLISPDPVDTPSLYPGDKIAVEWKFPDSSTGLTTTSRLSTKTSGTVTVTFDYDYFDMDGNKISEGDRKWVEYYMQGYTGSTTCDMSSYGPDCNGYKKTSSDRWELSADPDSECKTKCESGNYYVEGDITVKASLISGSYTYGFSSKKKSN